MAADYDTVTKYTFDKYELVFHNKDNSLNPEVRERMITTFATVYPQLVARFNPNSSRTVEFTVDPEYTKNPAVTSGNNIIFSAKWLDQHPADTDTVTHELMHVVQAYPSSYPSWLVEGIADYVRNKYGTNNEPANWYMPNYSPGQSYTNSYRVTARFLTWLENTTLLSIVDKLDSHLRQQTYNDDTWQKLTGNTVDELWSRYASNPTLSNIEPRTGIVSGDIYKLININSGKPLDVAQSGTVNGTNVQIFHDNSTAAQQWRIENIGNDLYKLISIHSCKVLDVNHSGTMNGTNVQIWNDNGSAGQQWRLQALADRDVYKLVNVISQKALDVDHSGTDDGTNVQIWTDNGTAAQKWQLIRLS